MRAVTPFPALGRAGEATKLAEQAHARRATRVARAFGARTSAASSALSMRSRPPARFPKSERAAASTPSTSPRKGVEVEPRFEDLRLGPAPLERERLAHLAPLVDEIAAPALFELGVQVGGELHGDRAAAAALAGRRLPERARQREPVDAAMLVEALVFGREHGARERGRDVGERHPIAAAPLVIDANARQRLAAAVEQPRVGCAPRVAHGGEVGDGGRARRRTKRRMRQQRARRSPNANNRPSLTVASRSHRGGIPFRGLAMRVPGSRDSSQRGGFHGFTATLAFGISPNISGAYSASTRVAGRSKRPGLLRRTVYSIWKRPFGTNW